MQMLRDDMRKERHIERQQEQPRSQAVAKKMGLKVELKKFTGEKKDWPTWSKAHLMNARMLDCYQALDVPEEEACKVARLDFDSGDHDETLCTKLRWRSDRYSGRARRAWHSTSRLPLNQCPRRGGSSNVNTRILEWRRNVVCKTS